MLSPQRGQSLTGNRAGQGWKSRGGWIGDWGDLGFKRGKASKAGSPLRYQEDLGKLARMKHPAKELGEWLKARRQKQGLVLRVFAGQIELSPAEYAEAEAGVVRWLSEEQATLIPQVLALSAPERKQFLARLAKARVAQPLEFKDIFTREQLEPARLRHARGRQAAARAKKEILDAVFAPLR